MALLTISGDPASRWEEVAHGAAQLLGYALVTEGRLAQWVAREFGDAAIPPRLWAPAAVSVLAPIAREHHLVIAVDGAEHFFRPMPSLFCVRVEAPQTQRVGNLMLDRRLEKDEATAALAELDRAQKLAATKVIKAIDKARPEVVIDVEILEVDRARLREYGLQVATPGSAGLAPGLDVNSQALSLQSLRNLTQADALVEGVLQPEAPREGETVVVAAEGVEAVVAFAVVVHRADLAEDGKAVEHWGGRS